MSDEWSDPYHVWSKEFTEFCLDQGSKNDSSKNSKPSEKGSSE